jgi:NADH-quinone oxidoreductase subunit J
LSVYAGGILILFIFAILLTSAKGDKFEPRDKQKVVYGIIAALAGITVTGFVTWKYKFLFSDNPTIAGDREIDMKVIGQALTGTEKYQYLLPFEVLGVLLLACAIGGILIARKR